MEWEERLEQAEREVARLAQSLSDLRHESETHRAQASESISVTEALREAVVRYAVACGAVDVQVAMLRARGSEGREYAMESLRHAMEEQTEASNALRLLAKSLQSSAFTPPTPPVERK